ncbi:hypothetical protein IJG28_00425 [Candidatus Saccharibacteria bacterium]|nr:hypothetical protein [Candidatus Saccharibacteria bacterium]
MDNNTWLAVIAGGKGTRLFPISNPDKPKQFCQLDRDNTFIQAAIGNFVGLGIKPNHVVVVTTSDSQVELAKTQTMPRGVLSQDIFQIAPDWGYPGAMYQATKYISKLDPDAKIICTPADQYLEATDDDFEYTIKVALEEAENDYPVLIGVKVNDLVTAMGCGHAIYEDGDNGCYIVNEFIEKPATKLADKLMRRDDTACNTGIAVWKASTLLKTIDEADVRGMGTDEFFTKFKKCKIAVGSFTWRDCGTFKSLYEISEKTPHHKNASLGEGTFERIRCRRSLLYAAEGMDLSVSDAEDDAIIFTTIDDKPIVVVAKLSDSQSVKELAEDYAKHEKFLKRDFSFGARNNSVLSSNISDELIVGFVGVKNYAVYVRKRQNGRLEAAVSKQLAYNEK